MSSGPTHRMAAGATAFAVTAIFAKISDARDLPHPLVAGTLATVFTNLPDLIEPATNPHHRQFFHSVAFAGAISYGLKRAYDWEPDSDQKRMLRHMLLIIGGAYLTHLALDAFTRRSLPLVGKL